MPGKLPAPIVAYTVRSTDPEPVTRLLVLEAAWSEPLGVISKESLANEGFESLAEFRRYWKARQFGYKAMSMVTVYRFRPFTTADHDPLAADLLERLYGPYLP